MCFVKCVRVDVFLMNWARLLRAVTPRDGLLRDLLYNFAYLCFIEYSIGPFKFVSIILV